MEITKEALTTRLRMLEAGREKAAANVNAHTGAIEDCQYWLGVLEQADKKEKE